MIQLVTLNMGEPIHLHIFVLIQYSNSHKSNIGMGYSVELEMMCISKVVWRFQFEEKKVGKNSPELPLHITTNQCPSKLQ